MVGKSYFIFEYLYRDGANFKAWGELLLTGSDITGVVEGLQKKFEDGVHFIAEQIGVPPLYGELWRYSNGPTEYDHVWHEFYCLRPADTGEVADVEVWGSVDDFLAKVDAVSDWQYRLSPHGGG